MPPIPFHEQRRIDWAASLEDDWFVHGDPPPTITLARPRLLKFHGDFNNSSAITSRWTLPQSGGGAGIEVTVAIGRGGRLPRYFSLALVPAVDERTVALWRPGDETAPAKWSNAMMPVAAVSVGPGLESDAPFAQINVGGVNGMAHRVSIRRETEGVQRIRLVLQRFRDGQCWLAVNGVATGHLVAVVPTGLRLQLFGDAVLGDVLVEQVRRWEGVEPTIAWNRSRDDIETRPLEQR